jgi:PAS domain-containing protein
LRPAFGNYAGVGEDPPVTADPPPTAAPKSLPLILAREFAANLATPMFLIDANGVLVFYNDAAALLLGRPFAELGEIPAGEFGAVLEMTTPDGDTVRRRDSPAGIAFFEGRPAHARVLATAYDGVRRAYEATAYPLFATSGDMHGVISVFWETAPESSG